MFVKMLAVLALSASFVCIASEPELPRMWEVTGTAANGNPLKFYILGISHLGLDPEYNEYFFKKVIPAFNSADIFSREAADWDPSLAPECPIPLEPTQANREMIRQAREKIRLHIQAPFDKLALPEIQGVTNQEQEEINEVIIEQRSVLSKYMADKYTELGLI